MILQIKKRVLCGAKRYTTPQMGERATKGTNKSMDTRTTLVMLMSFLFSASSLAISLAISV